MARNDSRETFDFIVIGAGSAGCVLANRISARPNLSVLLLEAGGSDAHPLVAAPLGETQMLGTKFDWNFKGEPEPELGDRRFALPRGRVLGGSSGINGQIYFRGHPRDYDEWVELGNPGWSYKDVLPYFKRSERWEGGESEYRGGSGPIRTAFGHYNNPLYDAFLEAGHQSGYQVLEDYNGPDQEGFARCQHTHFHRLVLRCSASYGYLWPVRGRSNLTIRKHSFVERILVQNGRATGTVAISCGDRRTYHAEREVLLCAGAYQSPQLLMLSGIGHADELRAVGVECLHHVPGVGKNLQDQISTIVQHRCLKPVTYFRYRNPLLATLAIAEWLVLQRGPFTVFPMDATAFIKSDPTLDRPDLQFYLLPLAVNPSSNGGHLPKSHAYDIHWCVIRPDSRGSVTLRSAHPRDHPIIFNNFFSAETDKVLNRRALPIARKLHAQKAFDSFRGSELEPGPDCRTDSDIDAFLTRYSATHHHPVGTCRMGHDDLSVVDHRLRVHGLESLRIIDASIIPRIVAGGTNATAMMIGERGADFILEGS